MPSRRKSHKTSRRRKQSRKVFAKVNQFAKNKKQMLINKLDTFLPDFGKTVILEIVNELPANISSILIATIITIVGTPLNPYILIAITSKFIELYGQQFIINLNYDIVNNKLSGLLYALYIISYIIYGIHQSGYVLDAIISTVIFRILARISTKIGEIFGISADNVLLVNVIYETIKTILIKDFKIRKSKAEILINAMINQGTLDPVIIEVV
jgi:hypothetical protein